MQFINVEFGFDLPPKCKDAKLGGGVTVDLGCYAIQLVKSIMKEKPVKIVATGILSEKGWCNLET